MASIYKDTTRTGWRVQLYVRGVRRKLWLGPVTKSAAATVAGHLAALNIARDTGTAPPAETRRWLASVSGRIRNRLAAWGIADGLAASSGTARTLGPYTRQYIDGREDWTGRTKSRMNKVRSRLVLQLGADTALCSITPGDAQRFARWCRSTIKTQSHSGKTIADARQLFRAAVDDRLIPENPFSGIDSSQSHDKGREAYIDRATVEALITTADPYYAALFALARFAGLRVPSEPLGLDWSSIDWETGRFTVYSPKLKRHQPTRIVPLFPEIRSHLDYLHQLAPDGAQYVFDRYRSTASQVWREALLRAAKRAGVPTWPKLWMNLRASCRTDLLERFPAHVVNYWLGHSGKVGAKHYDRTHDGHYAAAVGSPVGSSGRVPSLSTATGNAES